MKNQENTHSAPADNLTVFSPVLDAVAEASHLVPHTIPAVDRRVLLLCGLSAGLGIASAFVAQILMMLIAVITNFAFFGRLSLEHAVPADAVSELGWFVILIPVAGALIVGLMARYGSKAIRGHGIPEAMEQVLTNESRIPARLTFLKPISSAISIGTGGPFGAEGPIISTGGALGSVLGQLIRVSTAERKTLLAAGAAAGMSATFGAPVAAVLLAIELLLFEYRPRSIIPVAFASAAAAGVRVLFDGIAPVFAMPDLAPPTETALASYVLIGLFMGCCAVIVTRIVYAIEDTFERLPIHWMWWPAIGAVAVGVAGYIAPDTLGVGYYNISAILSNKLPVAAITILCGMKFISWSISLGSGTSGGTLAPLFTIGGGIGALLGSGVIAVAPWLGVDIRIAALVGMASIFAGASRAMLASAVFAFETTLQPVGLLPLLSGCAAAHMVASLLTPTSIMTEKIVRRGIRVPTEYLPDSLGQVLVRQVASPKVVALHADDQLASVCSWIASGASESSHQGFPVLDEHENLVGVVTRRDLVASTTGDNHQTIRTVIRRNPVFVYEDCTVRQAAEHLCEHGVGRLPVVARRNGTKVIGIVTRSDILSAFQGHMQERRSQAPSIRIRFPRTRGGSLTAQTTGKPNQ